MKLVFIENNRPVTDSLTVADKFGKEHARVLRDIRELTCSEQFRVGNFAESMYINGQGREMPRMLISFDGFMFIAMGYTGPTAAKLKEDYIGEFNRMRDELNKPKFTLPQNYVEALKALVGAEEEKAVLIEQNTHQEQQLRLQEPKVALYDVAMSAESVQPVGTVAKELGLGRTRLFALLREKKILRQNNEPYQEYIERGYFKLRLYTITHMTSGLENKTQPMVTPKGIAWLHKIIKGA